MLPYDRCQGVFCPLHGHAAKQEIDYKVYEKLYQAAAEKWVAQGVLSHAICLYKHERDLQEVFFMNGLVCAVWIWPEKTTVFA
jgi:hypothetical protein